MRIILRLCKSTRAVCVLLFAVQFFVNSALLAQKPASLDVTDDQLDRVVAKIGTVTVRRQEVQNRIPDFARLKGQLNPQQIRQLESVALDSIVDQRIVFEFLKTHNLSAKKSEVALQLEAFEAELAVVEKKLGDYLTETKQTKDEFLRKIEFVESWKQYLRTKLTEANLKKYFNDHQRQFDGTDVRVSHLMIKSAPREDREPIVEKTKQILQQIRLEKLTWLDAIEQHSDGTKIKGGELGWVVQKPVMPPEFTAAARELDLGEISEPIETYYGVHLIRCLEVKAGKVSFGDAKKDVTKALKGFLFQQIVAQHRERVNVEIMLDADN